MREVNVPAGELPIEVASFLACLATVLELPFAELPRPAPDENPATGWTVSRWLGGLGLGLARVADARSFSWPGPWIAAVATPPGNTRRFVVMYGVPSAVVWDPAGGPEPREHAIEDGFLVAAADVALALPRPQPPPSARGTVAAICIAGAQGLPVVDTAAVRAIAGRGLEGDRYLSGEGTFPSGPPGSALTMIEAEVCQSFDPPLSTGEHRRNLVTSGIELNGLVGREFAVGEVRCRGMRLCEPCAVVDRYATRPVLRALVHRGGLRADILTDGWIRVGDEVRAV